VLAVLVSASLFAPVPVKAQDAPIWSATLTVTGLGGAEKGCSNEGGIGCEGRLSDDEFTLDGQTYHFYLVALDNGQLSVIISSTILFSNVRDVRTVLDDYKFCVGHREFAISSATHPANYRLTWSNTGLSWSAGDTVELSIGSSCAHAYTLSVEATPECGSEVTNTSVELTHVLVLTPAPNAEAKTERRWVTESTTGEWLGSGPISSQSGRSITSTSGPLTYLRDAYPGFRGFEYRLKDTPDVTAECTWTFSEQTTPRSTNQPPPNTGGTGGGGGGGGGLPPPGRDDEPPPDDGEPPTACPQGDRETLGSFYEMTGGENWDENENWNSEEPLDQWHGVDTDDPGEVVSLRLPDNNLSGKMPTAELLCLKELVELALWGNDDLMGKVPDELVLAVERAALRDIAETLDVNPQWFENYGDPYDFEDWHEGVTTDDDGRVTGLDLTGEGVLEEIPESVSELQRLRDIMRTTSSEDGGCALSPEDDSSAFSLFLVSLLVFAVLGRTRARG